MCNFELVAIVNRLDYLLPEEFGLKFRHLSVWLHLEVAVQGAAIHVLHKDEDLLVRLEGFVEFGNVGMVQLLHNLHFALHRLAPVWLQ